MKNPTTPNPTPPPPPWSAPPLNKWNIIGMNHYHVNGVRYIFVAMTRKGLCIQEEGKDDQFLWNRLWHKAVVLECGEELGTQIASEALAGLKGRIGFNHWWDSISNEDKREILASIAERVFRICVWFRPPGRSVPPGIAERQASSD